MGDGRSNPGDQLEARHVLIASGAQPVALGITGEAHLTSSDDFPDLARLPERIVLVRGDLTPPSCRTWRRERARR